MSPSLVLIVEDDFLVRQSAVFLLKEAGFDTLEAGSADEAVPLLEARQDIKVVFTDINMPGSMDGLELAQAIVTAGRRSSCADIWLRARSRRRYA